MGKSFNANDMGHARRVNHSLQMIWVMQDGKSFITNDIGHARRVNHSLQMIWVLHGRR